MRNINDPLNAGTGRRLTSEESREKTKNWPIFQKDFKPKGTFEELAFSFFRGEDNKTSHV